MATENIQFNTTIKANEDLRDYRYHAIALNDGLKAINGAEAGGLIHSKPNSGDFCEMMYFGEGKFRAGGAAGAGAKLTVDSNSTIIAATSGSWIVGRAKAAVTSGSIGTGFFNFTAPAYASESSFVL